MGINELVRETVVGLLYGIFNWGSRLTSQIISWRSRTRVSSASSLHHADDEKKVYYGLSIALDPPEVENAKNHDDDEKETTILKSCTEPPPPPPPSPSPSRTSFFTLLPSELSSLWTTSTTGDFLGTESGVHMVSTEPTTTAAAAWGNLQVNTSVRKRVKNNEMKSWDIPPPLTWLQGREHEYDYNSSTVSRPYSLNREYINGRLVLKENAVEKFEHLKATGGAVTRRLPVHVVVREDNQENSFPVADDNKQPAFPD